MAAVLFALCSAALFGAMTVSLRVSLARAPHAQLGSLVTVAVAFAVSLAALPLAEGAADVAALALFAVGGALAPGGAQLLFTLGVRDAGAARASVVVGAAPLVAVTIALVALDEPLRAPLALGALLIVAGGIALVGERERPPGFRAVGLVWAAGCTVLFATRDNVVRWAAVDTDVDPLAAAAATLLGGLTVGLAAALARRPARVPPRALAVFVPVGLLFGLSYLALFEAYERGRVSVVSPLVATETLFTVLLSALLLHATELPTRRLAAGAAFVVAGSALIGATR